MRAKGLWLLFTLAACAAPPPPEEPATASRAEVTEALYEQLGLVKARHEVLENAGSDSAAREQRELVRLATEIVGRIVRIDPQADIDALILQISSYE